MARVSWRREERYRRRSTRSAMRVSADTPEVGSEEGDEDEGDETPKELERVEDDLELISQ